MKAPRNTIVNYVSKTPASYKGTHIRPAMVVDDLPSKTDETLSLFVFLNGRDSAMGLTSPTIDVPHDEGKSPGTWHFFQPSSASAPAASSPVGTMTITPAAPTPVLATGPAPTTAPVHAPSSALVESDVVKHLRSELDKRTLFNEQLSVMVGKLEAELAALKKSSAPAVHAAPAPAAPAPSPAPAPTPAPAVEAPPAPSPAPAPATSADPATS
jgi:hypothetical protein